MNAPSMSRSAPLSPVSDADLWRASRAGDRDAFGRIVERYQSLVAAIAYSRTGDLAAASDFAQETFVTAWRKQHDLREPALLKSWLAGIARNLTANAAKVVQRRGGVPVALDGIAEPAAREASPEAHAVSKQEEELLWNTLAELPESYREPLVLFYREERSVAEVASQLELSEDAVKQRLSRGRAMLKAEMSALVESALARSRPGASFGAAVLAAITFTAPTGAALATKVSGAAVAGAASGAASGAATGKGTVAGIGGAAVAGPAAGLLTAWLASKLAGATARSDDERRAIAAAFRGAFLFVVPMIGLILGLVWAGTTRFAETPAFLAVTATLWTVTLVGVLIRMANRTEQRIAALRAGSGVSDSAWFAELARRGVAPSRARRYQSRLRLFGLPLFAYASGGVDAGAAFDRSTRRGARGWLAVGDLAISPLLAVGGVAIAPIAFGGVTVGLLSLSVAGIAVGAVAVGSLAFGWTSYGIIAVGWQGAAGVTAIAHQFALGSQASALEANSPAAVAWFRDAWFTPFAAGFGAALPALVLLAIVVPLGLMARRAVALRRRRPGAGVAP
jgi:RNA polymerase sigma factor (sigma-70 family)